MSSNHILVAALDFGTTYSGYAFQFRHKYDEKCPTNAIVAPQSWNNGKKQIVSLKTPTCLLLTKDEQIDSFGFEAEQTYSDACNDEDQDEWLFFKRFKMRLFEGEDDDDDSDNGAACKGQQKKKCVSTQSTLTDEHTDKSVLALDVFSKSIQCLKKKLLEHLNEKKTKIVAEDIFYVLTVPAIWDDKAKGFMREAAMKADIKSSNFLIALEPEAASLFCQYIPVDKFSGGSGEAQCRLAAPGTVYMIVDLGGGTADITVHQKLESGQLREVHSACGGPWGGTAVDAYFIQMLSGITLPLVMSDFMHDSMSDYIDLMTEFEAGKRNVTLTSNSSLSIKIPSTLNTLVQEHHDGKTFKEVVADSPFSSNVSVVGDKLKIDAVMARTFFKRVCDKIIDQMEKCIDNIKAIRDIDPISLILMVGGFSESPYIQQAVKQRFETDQLHILIPDEAGLSVLKGAVIFGRQPDGISSRILRFSYGAEITPPFDSKVHDQRYRTSDGKRCNHVFQSFADKDTEVKLGHKLHKVYTTIQPMQKTIQLKLFSSDNPNTRYTVDKGCNTLGTLNLTLNTPTAELQDLEVTYEFGGTEIKVYGKEVKTNRTLETSIKLM